MQTKSTKAVERTQNLRFTRKPEFYLYQGNGPWAHTHRDRAAYLLRAGRSRRPGNVQYVKHHQRRYLIRDANMIVGAL